MVDHTPDDRDGTSRHPLQAVRVVDIVDVAASIRRFVLASAGDSPLVPFKAGAHLSVHLPGGIVRQYSLCNSPASREHYEIAVLREPNSRGGSRYLFEQVDVGDHVKISTPVNFFELNEAARRSILFAGGIGITPILSMIERLDALGSDYFLHYCTRSEQDTAFLDRVEPRVVAGRARVYHDDGVVGRGIDLEKTIAKLDGDEDVYYCGPSGFMSALSEILENWPRERIHLEYFSKDNTRTLAPLQYTKSFRIRLRRCGTTVEVAHDESIVEALARIGVSIPTSCQDGYCGTCMTRYLEGTPLHRDTVLSGSIRDKYLLACCARAVTDEIVLDP